MTAPAAAKPAAPAAKPAAPAAPVSKVAPGTLTITAPAGAHWEREEVKTNRGTETVASDAPILVWDDVDAMTTCYTEQGILDIADGTSLRVSFQNIARRMLVGSKHTYNEVAEAQIKFRPGKREGGVSTPQSRAKRAAAAASEKVSGDAVAAFLARVAKGEIKLDEAGNISK